METYTIKRYSFCVYITIEKEVRREVMRGDVSEREMKDS